MMSGRRFAEISRDYVTRAEGPGSIPAGRLGPAQSANPGGQAQFSRFRL